MQPLYDMNNNYGYPDINHKFRRITSIQIYIVIVNVKINFILCFGFFLILFG